jgi:hypothetical protein
MKTPIRRTPKLKDNMIFYINIKRNSQKKTIIETIMLI